MEINLYIATLEIENHKGICTITAYESSQAKEIAENYWQGYEEYNGNITISQISNITCNCGVSTSLVVLCGNSLDSILNMSNENGSSEKYKIGQYTFDTIRQTLIHEDGEIANLTTKELDVLLILVQYPNKLIERDFILEKVWGESNYFNSRSMDVYITKLRKHFKKDERIELINVHGKGFKFVVPNK